MPTAYFEYESVARDAGLSSDALTALSRLVRDEFPADDMMYELHMLRACMAVRDGRVSVERLLANKPAVGS